MEKSNLLVDSDHKKDANKGGDITFAEFWVEFKINFSKAYPFLMALWLVFTVTFTVFPGSFLVAGFGFTSNKENDKTQKAAWDLAVTNLMFNVFDSVGRFFGGKIMIKKRTVVMISIARLVFLFTTASTIMVHSSPFNADWFRILNIAIYAATNGYTATQCAIQAP